MKEVETKQSSVKLGCLPCTSKIGVFVTLLIMQLICTEPTLTRCCPLQHRAKSYGFETPIEQETLVKVTLTER